MWRYTITILVLAIMAGAGISGWIIARQPGRFPLRDVKFYGVVHIQPSQAMAVMGLNQGVNLFTLDPVQMQQRMLTIPWVRQAAIDRILPDRVEIRVEEKNVVATGRHGEQLFLLDEYGSIIKPLESGEPIQPPVVTFNAGVGSAPEVVHFLNLISRHPWLKERLSEAVSLSAHRWVLYTRQGVRILIARDGDQALELLRRLQDKQKLLDRNILQVDLRVPGRIAIRPQPVGKGES